MSQQSSPRSGKAVTGSKRSKYVTKACEPCRQRRAKCDGQKPACTSCLKKSIDCQYSVASDGRKPASRSYVQLLRDRIELLECIVRRNSIDIDDTIAQYQAERQNLPGGDVQESITTTAQLEEICATFEGALSLDESINFDGDGECHYFGPTSGRLHFQHLQSPSSGHIVIPHDNLLGISTTSRHARSPLAHEAFSKAYQMHTDVQLELIDHYFAWQNPWFPVLDESLFRMDLSTGKGRFFSPLLLNCVLSAGARFSDRSELRTDPQDPKTAGVQLLEEAEAALNHELLSPSLTTIQSVAIMIYLNASRAADTRAWLHQGTAHRLALDMGLNIDATSIPNSNEMSLEEVNLRRQIYWSLYCADKLHATWSGRVCTMLDIQGAVRLPSLPAAVNPEDGVELRSRRSIDLLRAHVGQSQIVEKILLGFYAPQPSQKGSRQAQFFNATLLELQNWLYDLPDHLRLDVRGQPSNFPQIYILHMTLHTALILLGNGVLAGSTRSDSSKTSEMKALDKKASSVCYQAATNICVAAKKYRSKFGNFYKSAITATHCLLSAALVLIQVASSESEASIKRAATANFDHCLQCLDELSARWKIAEHIHRNLTLLKAQKLGLPLSKHGPLATNPAGTQVWVTEHQYDTTLPNITDLLGYNPTDTVLLNDAHSFLESHSNNDNPLDDFDFAAQLADIGMQDSFLWGNFGMGFPPGS